jgi:SAM-dependent methyltransferase
MKKKSFFQALKDFIFTPLRFLLPNHISRKLTLSSLQDERILAVFPEIEGSLLDVGAGDNMLVNTYGQGVGVDVYDWGGGALIVKDSAKLPFKSSSFDTITCLAALNHIPNREEVVSEVFRLLRPGGHFVVTMIPLWLGKICHRIQFFDEHRKREVKEGELFGMSNQDIIDLCTKSGFTFVSHKRFLFSLNNLLKFQKAL